MKEMRIILDPRRHATAHDPLGLIRVFSQGPQADRVCCRQTHTEIRPCCDGPDPGKNQRHSQEQDKPCSLNAY